MENNILEVIPVYQNQQEFFIGKVSISRLLTFTRYSERLIIGYDEQELPIYNTQVQRKLEMSRVRLIEDFLIENPEAIFPTNIVLNIPEVAIDSVNEKNNYTEIHLNDKVFEGIKKEKIGSERGDVYISIIDGQHRLKGIESAIERLENESNSAGFTAEKRNRLNDLLSIELLVTFFIDKSLEYQAMVFSTINRTQKRVSQDLVYSLFGLKSSDTPYKTALEVVLALNSHPNSPFYRRIKLYGGTYLKGESRPLSQATLIKSIVALISESMRESERDIHRSRKDLKRRNNNKFLPFRDYYADGKDYIISDILFYYFKAVSTIFTKNGESIWYYDYKQKPKNILQTTVGFEALLKILVDILNYSNFNEDKINDDFFSSFLIKAKDLDFENQNIYPFSTKGKNILYLSLSLKIWEVLPHNSPDDRRKKLDEWLNTI